ncbi:MAG TPA: hypothetical protein VNF93_01060 [Buchnera sp. (in: enterobacteria)]|nr:hypothetical protein [Buchnera sp. (in: enterobacteria)]
MLFYLDPGKTVLSRFENTKIALPGNYKIGSYPINLYIIGLKK